VVYLRKEEPLLIYISSLTLRWFFEKILGDFLKQEPTFEFELGSLLISETLAQAFLTQLMYKIDKYNGRACHSLFDMYNEHLKYQAHEELTLTCTESPLNEKLIISMNEKGHVSQSKAATIEYNCPSALNMFGIFASHAPCHFKDFKILSKPQPFKVPLLQ